MINRKGISLIVLIITIVVVLILASAILLTISKNNPIEQAKKSIEQQNFATAKDKLVILLSDCLLKKAIDNVTFESYFNQKKAENEISEIVNNEDGTCYIELNGYEFLVKEATLEILQGEKVQGARIEVRDEITSNMTKATIKLFVSTEDEQGIKSIQKPDGNINEYNNHEKNIVIDYEVQENKIYTFKIESNSGRRKIYTVNISNLALLDIEYINGVDNQNVENTYATSIAAKNQEQLNLITEMSKLNLVDNMIYPIKNISNNSWSVVAQSKTELLPGYYLFDRYNTTNTLSYYFPNAEWIVTNPDYVIPNYPYLTGYKEYTFSATSGLQVSNYHTSGITQYLYRLSGNTLTRYQFMPQSGDTKNTHYSISYRTQTEIVTVKQGSYINQVFTTENAYPNNWYINIFWYVRRNQINKLYIYKYVDNEVKSIYEPVSMTFTTKQVTFPSPMKDIKLKLEANNTNYNIYISNDNSNWTKIEDKTKLNGDDIIQLPGEWDKIAIKIETNAAVINRLTLKSI